MIPMFLNEHDCPWLNYKTAIGKNDNRHLLDGNFTTFPKVSNYQLKKLNELLEDLNYSLPDGSYDLKLARLRDYAWEQYFNSVAENPEQYQKAFAEYKKELDNLFTDFEITFDPGDELSEIAGVKYKKLKDLHDDIKSALDWDTYTAIIMYVIEGLNYVPRTEVEDNIYKDVAFIQAMMDVKINPRKDSVAYVANYMVLAKIELKRRKNEKNTRQKSKKKS